MYNVSLPSDTNELINFLIAEHKFNKMPRYSKLMNYYMSKHDIVNRTMSASYKPNNKIVNPFPSYIVNTVQGYLLGQPVKYTYKDSKLEAIMQNILDQNDEEDKNVKLEKALSIMGEAFELVYFNESSELRFAQLPNEQTLVHYNDSIEPEVDLAFRYMTGANNIVKAELYYSDRVDYYTAQDGQTFVLTESKPQYFGVVPVIHYLNNEELTGDFERAISMIDDYDKIVSDSANEFEYTVNCFLMLYGFGDIDEPMLKQFKESGIFTFPSADSGADAKFLEKNINDTAIQNQLKLLKANIHNLLGIPDLSDENFAGNASGVAIRQKLLGLEMFMSAKERKFSRGLYNRARLIVSGLNKMGHNFNWRDITAKFTRNLPQNMLETSEIIKNLNGIAPLEDLLSMLPQNIIEEPQKSAKEIKSVR